jgi:hypothetical protein
MDGWMDGWTDGRTDGRRMDGWMEDFSSIESYHNLNILISNPGLNTRKVT